MSDSSMKSAGAYSPDKALAFPERLEDLKRGGQPYPVHLHLIISDLCNQDCPGCAYRMSGYSSNQLFSGVGKSGEVIRNPHRMLDTDLVKSVLDDCVKMGVRAVEFSVKGDELIPIAEADGSVRVHEIGAWVDGIFDRPNPTGRHEEKSTKGLGLKSFAIDDSGKVVLGEIEAVYRHRASEPLFEVVLEDGRAIRVTGSHSLNAIRDGQIKKIPVTQLRIGDEIACATWTSQAGLPRALSVPPDGYHMTKQIRDEIAPSRELFRLLGYYTAEGSQPSNSLLWCFGNGPREETYRADVLQCIEAVFGIPGAILADSKGDLTRVAIHSKRAVMLFEKLGALGVQAERRVPSIVWNAPAEWKVEYLVGLFSGDGNFRSTIDSRGFRRNSLHLKTCNRGLANEVMMLMRQLDVRATLTRGKNKARMIEGRKLGVSDYYSINVYAADELKKLWPILDALDATPAYQHDSIYSRPGKRGVPAAFGSEAEAVRIKSIRKATELGRPIVYDITVAGTHRFLTVAGIGAWNTGGGESTVHPDAPEILAYAQSLGLDTALITNGLLLKRMGESAVRTKWLRISIDAATEATYAKVRPAFGGEVQARGNFHRVCATLREAVDLRNQLATDCLIGVGFVVQKENWHEIFDFCEMAKHLGADNVRISGLFTPEAGDYHAEYRERAEVLEREAKKLELSVSADRPHGFRVYARFHEKVADLAGPPDYPNCWYQHLTTYLGGDGNLYRCCVTSYNRQGLIGNVKEAGGFKALWDSKMKGFKFAKFDARTCKLCQFSDRNRAINAAIQAPELPAAPADLVHKTFV